MTGIDPVTNQAVPMGEIPKAAPRPWTRSTGYKPMPGYSFNPLRSFRNIPCPCGSNRKAKRCHGAAEILPDSEVAVVKAYLMALSAEGMITVRAGDIA
jgi:uncharacterized protein YecA (UPF0149 family)